MSEHREQQDEAHYERMLELDEYAPACVDPDEPHRRYQLADDTVGVRRGTYTELREMKILEGLCPYPGCCGTLDSEGYCFGCGNVSVAPAGEEGEKAKAA